MKRKIILNSFFKFVLLTALVHIGILVIRTIKDRNLEYLNYFGILDLDAFFLKITKGWISNMLSILFVTIGLGLFMFFGLRKKELNEK